MQANQHLGPPEDIEPVLRICRRGLYLSPPQLRYPPHKSRLASVAARVAKRLVRASSARLLGHDDAWCR